MEMSHVHKVSMRSTLSFILRSGILMSGLCLADDPKDLQQEAKNLAKQGSSAIPRLSELIFDPTPAVRAQAVHSLVEIGTQYSLDPLTRSVADGDPQIQIAAINGLVNFYLPGYVQASGLQSSMKKTGAKVVSRFIAPEQQLIPPYVVPRPVIIGVLVKQISDSKDNQVRAAAAKAAGVLRGSDAVDALIAALRSKDDALLYESVSAIEKIRDPKAAPRLVLLFRDPKEHIQLAALEAAGLLHNAAVVPDLERTLTFSLTSKARRAALGALGKLSSESSRPMFDRNLEDKDDGVRAAAAEGIARLNHPVDLQRMESLFKEERKMEPRLAQAFAMVSLGEREMKDFSALKYLIDSLNSKAWGGVAEAYLIEVARTPAVLQSIHSAASQAPKDEKIRIARVLAASGDKSSIGIVEGLSRGADLTVAEESLRALRVLKARLP